MKNKQIFWAIVFGAMLAITGCGDSGSDETGDGGSGASAGSGGSSGSGFCGTLCSACNPDQAGLCNSECEAQIANFPGGVNLDSCPNELNAVGQCLSANDCNSDNCDNQLTTWISCVIGVAL